MDKILKNENYNQKELLILAGDLNINSNESEIDVSCLQDFPQLKRENVNLNK
jgi:hypothetical protein